MRRVSGRVHIILQYFDSCLIAFNDHAKWVAEEVGSAGGDAFRFEVPSPLEQAGKHFRDLTSHLALGLFVISIPR